MNIVENKLRELHIALPACPTPVAAYLPAVQAGNFVFASGQTPIVDGELLYQGKLGRDLGIEEGYGRQAGGDSGNRGAEVCCRGLGPD